MFARFQQPRHVIRLGPIAGGVLRNGRPSLSAAMITLQASSAKQSLRRPYVSGAS